MAARFEVGGFAPYASVAEWVPGLAQARSLWRAGLFTQLALALGTAALLPALVDFAARRWPTPNTRRVATAAAVAIGCLAAFEVWPPRQKLHDVPREEAYRSLAEWIGSNVPPRTPVRSPTLPRRRRRAARAAGWASGVDYLTGPPL